MVAAAAREIRDGEKVFVGMRLPLLGFAVAKELHAPNALGIFENGVIRPGGALNQLYDFQRAFDLFLDAQRVRARNFLQETISVAPAGRAAENGQKMCFELPVHRFRYRKSGDKFWLAVRHSRWPADTQRVE